MKELYKQLLNEVETEHEVAAAAYEHTVYQYVAAVFRLSPKIALFVSVILTPK